MNIVLSTDDNFVQHCSATIMSLLSNNKNVNIYILTEGLTVANERILQELVMNNGGVFHLIVVNNLFLKNCPMPRLDCVSHISIATYYRLLIADILPLSVKQVLYLDCDIIVRHDISVLMNTQLKEYAIGAVYQIADWNVDTILRLGYPLEYGYFNAGVLLINLEYWRTNHITKKLLEYLKNNNDKIIYHDQDVLNAVLHRSCLRLSCRWNMLTPYFKKSIFAISDIDIDGNIVCDHQDYKNIIYDEVKNPFIIHYVSRPKPWESGCDHPWRKEYYKYLSKTFFGDYRPPKSFYKEVKKLIKKWVCKDSYI